MANVTIKMNSIIIFIGISVTCTVATSFSDKPCAARVVSNRSVVCVCTADYCDTVIRETPVTGHYFTYTSSEGGQRFSKTRGNLNVVSRGKIEAGKQKDHVLSCTGKGNDTYDATLLLEPTKLYQTIFGFGGAVTDSAAINYMNLTDPDLKEKFIESYCGSTGVEYSMLRVPIGSSDFATHAYAYNELPVDDAALSNFSLSHEDYDYKIPMIRACMAAARAPIKTLGSLWSPPPWMKNSNAFVGYGLLKPEYFQTLADYFYKFMEKYEEEGITMWGITLTNEPLDGAVNEFDSLSLGWRLDHLAEWVIYHLGPTIRNSTFKDVKILAGDDQRFAIPLFWNMLINKYPGALDYIDGVAVHFYFDKTVAPSIVTAALADNPEKFILYTEACIFPSSSEPLVVDYGSWIRAETYITDIIENLNYNSTGWIDWNICLNTDGGPNWADNFVDAPVIVDAEAGEFIKQPMFYAIGHFSKFIPQGSRRIQVAVTSGAVHNVAFLTPDESIVVVLYNENDKEVQVEIQFGDNQAIIQMEGKSITTVEFPYKA